MPIFWIEALLYAAFLVQDAGWVSLPVPADWLRYAAICLLAVAAAAGFVKRRKYAALALAAVLIPAADWVLLFRPEKAVIGILVFLAVHTAYTAHLAGGDKKAFRRMMLVRLLLFAGGALAARLAVSGAELTECLAAGYILVFAANLAAAIRAACQRKDTESIRFAAGVFLFFLCDLHVGLYNAPDLFGGAVRAYAQGFAGIAMWLFYLPGQCLITSLPALAGAKTAGRRPENR